jgi:hypothetical protein
MEDYKNLPKEISRFAETNQEKNILKLQHQFLEFNKNIWGTDNCERCGSCCYKYRIEEIGKNEIYANCKNLEIRDAIPYCRTQEEKPETCKAYSCKNRGSALERFHMVKMATNILETKTNNDLEKMINDNEILKEEEFIKIKNERRERREQKRFESLSKKDQQKCKKGMDELLRL